VLIDPMNSAAEQRRFGLYVAVRLLPMQCCDSPLHSSFLWVIRVTRHFNDEKMKPISRKIHSVISKLYVGSRIFISLSETIWFDWQLFIQRIRRGKARIEWSQSGTKLEYPVK